MTVNTEDLLLCYQVLFLSASHTSADVTTNDNDLEIQSQLCNQYKHDGISKSSLTESKKGKCNYNLEVIPK